MNNANAGGRARDDQRSAPMSDANRTRPAGDSPTRPAARGGDAGDGVTVPWWQNARNGDAAAGGRGTPRMVEPVVGWLVAISGVNKGRDYRLYPQGNTIGRNAEFKVDIEGDNSVTRKVHARIFYNPLAEEGAYVLTLGDEDMIFLNDEAVYSPTPLKPYDIIRLGTTHLLFVPLCNTKFRWTLDDKAPAPGQGLS